ncbi:chaperonin 10-like protein [Filobasidium floriforme]|uniref:chaperonin 10-like protein n=1 Tax=Filobasidium floriforme TaxID=5210 RepID=UPI001E8DFC93|nr:chaperonin 10-like protein [Filobasidium floriforme]KAH8080028.1 chaperonin 10-like protein [Filobasidium floriforme]
MTTEFPQTIRAVVTNPKLASLELKEIPFASRSDIIYLGPNAVVVRNQAIALNPTDYKYAYEGWAADKSAVMGTDGAGTVIAVGSNVKHVKVGDRVSGMVFGASSQSNGTFAESTCSVTSMVMQSAPTALQADERCHSGYSHGIRCCPFHFEWHDAAPDACGHSGATAVGHHAVQLAHLSGYRVFTTASPANHQRLLELGADKCFDYRSPSVVDDIKAAAGEQGIYAAYDTPASNGSTANSIGPNGGRVMSTVPADASLQARRSDVEVGFVLVYTMVGYPFKFANGFDFPALHEDNRRALEWVTQKLPALLEGWQEGQGSARYKPQKLRFNHGLDKAHEGVAILGKGAYQAEKLVYLI